MNSLIPLLPVLNIVAYILTHLVNAVVGDPSFQGWSNLGAQLLK